MERGSRRHSSSRNFVCIRHNSKKVCQWDIQFIFYKAWEFHDAKGGVKWLCKSLWMWTNFNVVSYFYNTDAILSTIQYEMMPTVCEYHITCLSPSPCPSHGGYLNILHVYIFSLDTGCEAHVQQPSCIGIVWPLENNGGGAEPPCRYPIIPQQMLFAMGESRRERTFLPHPIASPSHLFHVKCHKLTIIVG